MKATSTSFLFIVGAFVFTSLQAQSIYEGTVGGKQIFDLYLYKGDQVTFNYSGFKNAKLKIIMSSVVDLGGIPILSDKFETIDIGDLNDGHTWDVESEGGYTFNLNLSAVGDSWAITHKSGGAEKPIRPLWINDYEYDQHRKDLYLFNKEQLSTMRLVASFRELATQASGSKVLAEETVQVTDYTEDAFDNLGSLSADNTIQDPDMNSVQFYFEEGEKITIRFEADMALIGKDDADIRKKIQRLKDDELLYINFRVKPMDFHYMEHNGSARSYFPVDYELSLNKEFKLVDEANGLTKAVGTEPYKWVFEKSFLVGTSGFYSMYLATWNPSYWNPEGGYKITVSGSDGSKSRLIEDFILAYYSEWGLEYIVPADYMGEVSQKGK